MYTILSLSDSDKHFDSAIAEYLKRLPKNLTILSCEHQDQVIGSDHYSVLLKFNH